MNVQAKIADGQAGVSIQQQLSEFAANLSHSDIPADVRTRAVHHMLDAAGIAMASTRYDFAHKTLAGFRALGDEGRVPVFGMAAHLNPRDAATMNGFLCHGLDYDDTHIAAIVHPTASVMPAVLSAASMTGATGEQMVTAYIIGVEAAARVGAAAKSQFHQVGYHPTGMVGIFGCVLAVGRILGLNAKQMSSAQGLALSMASGSMQFLEDGAWNKRFHPGWAASSAITAACLAREGFVGASDPYDGRYGLYKSFLGLGPRMEQTDPSLATAGLGAVWELLETAIKPFPTCHFTHGAIDAALALRPQINDPSAIQGITVKVAEGMHAIICEPEEKKKKPANDYDAKFSVHYLVATAMLRGRLTLDELEPDVLSDPDILELTSKVSFVDDPESLFPKAYSGEVVVTMDDGREMGHREQVNRGAADRPLSNDDILVKWHDNAGMLVNGEKAAKLQEAVLALDEAPDAVAVFEGFAG
ncbi:MAG: 2-methylcitrate dehydratase PrpD [Hyphomicrobiaceae bacterium]|jgi:2-methylcitrate dehydratase PrpD